LPRPNRLVASYLIERVLRKGQRTSSGALLVARLPKREGVARVAIIVGKKVSNKATVRNRYKRVLRELIKANLTKFHNDDCVVMLKYAPSSITDIKELAAQCFAKSLYSLSASTRKPFLPITQPLAGRSQKGGGVAAIIPPVRNSPTKQSSDTVR